MATELAPRETTACDSVSGAEGVWEYRISRELYDRMIEAGIFTTEDRIELLDGRLYEMAPMGNPHRAVINHVLNWLVKSLPDGWHVNCQTPIALDDFSEPEPDFAVVRGTTRDYRHRQPRPEDIGLLVEISHSSLSYDRKRKLPAYAEAGIPEYWILNLVENVVEVRTDPQPRMGETRGIYSTTREIRGEQSVSLRLDEETVTTISVNDLLLLSD